MLCTFGNQVVEVIFEVPITFSNNCFSTGIIFSCSNAKGAKQLICLFGNRARATSVVM